MTKENLTKLLAAVVVIGLVGAVVLLVLPGSDKKHLTAEFPRTVSLYEGSDVKILGIKVGSVDSVEPAGTKVIVTLSYDGKYKIPAAAKAALVSPSVVGDRYIQLTPAYTKGAVLADDAKLGLDRTATPLELDQIFSSLNDLTKALGPDNANKADSSGEGALSRLLDTTAKNFGGQGAEFNRTITNLGKLTRTLSDNKDELFGTARQVEDFVKILSENDATVRQFTDSLDSAADLLAGERDDLAAALRNLGTALVQVKGFVKGNKTLLSKNIKGLLNITRILVKRRGELDEIARTAPAALNNLGLAYNPRSGTLDTRANLGEIASQLTSNPSVVLCSLVGSSPQASKLCKQLTGNNRPAALTGSSGSAAGRDRDRVHVAQHVDRSLGGLVEVRR